MSPDERRRRLQVILDQLNDAAKELRESSEAIRATRARAEDTHEAIAKATTAMIAANRAALALFNDTTDE